MKNTFSIECESFGGLATFQIYIGDHTDNLSKEEHIRRLSQRNPFRCCFDTGANHTFISKRVAETLTEPSQIQTANVIAASFASQGKIFFVDMLLPNDIVIARHPVALSDGLIDILIGMDIIGSGDFALTRRDGKPFLSVTWPHKQTIDFLK